MIQQLQQGGGEAAAEEKNKSTEEEEEKTTPVVGDVVRLHSMRKHQDQFLNMKARVVSVSLKTGKAKVKLVEGPSADETNMFPFTQMDVLNDDADATAADGDAEDGAAAKRQRTLEPCQSNGSEHAAEPDAEISDQRRASDFFGEDAAGLEQFGEEL